MDYKFNFSENIVNNNIFRTKSVIIIKIIKIYDLQLLENKIINNF